MASNWRTAFMNLVMAANSARDLPRIWACAACGAKWNRRWMSDCWRRCTQGYRTVPGSHSVSTVWSRLPWERRDWRMPWPSPSTTPDRSSVGPSRSRCVGQALPATRTGLGARPPARPGLVLAARQVLAGAGIDAQNLAFVDEQRHPHHGARFQLGRFGAAGGGITANARIRLDHFEFHVCRRRHLQGHTVPQCDDADRAIFQPLSAVADGLFGGCQLLEGLGHHEVEEISFPIQILHVRIDHVGSFHGVAGLPRPLDGAACFKVTHPNAIERLTFTRLDHLILDDRVGVAVDQNFKTGLEFVRAVVRHRRPRT